MEDDRTYDKKLNLYRMNSRKGVSLDLVKSQYIADGLSIDEIAEIHAISKAQIERIVEEHNLPELRKAYMQHGIQKIQNTQLNQAHKLLNLENGFKNLRLIQLQENLEEYAQYYARYGDLKKRNPITGEVLRNDAGIALTLKIPDVSKEIKAIKESVTVSEGMAQILSRLESLVLAGTPITKESELDTIDVVDFNELFNRED